MQEKASTRLNLARKYRPRSLEELSGQAGAMSILKEALRSDRIAPAYLFSGPRGVGKTSSARIFAKAACCLSKEVAKRPCDHCDSCKAVADGRMMDILEIDGASHTGVDDVRRIIESVAYRPSVGARNVYIIDEVHMLSNAAFNALLKTLEEPPSHALFLFATTEPEKLPSTILSRVQRLELRRIKDKEVYDNLDGVCKKEGIKISPHTLEQIATAADGSLRDGQTLLEQVTLLSASSQVSEEIVDSFLGTIGSEQELLLMQMISKQQSFEILQKLQLYFEKGKDLAKLLSRLIHWTRCLLLSRATQSTSLFEEECSTESLEKLQQAYRDWSVEDLDRLFEVLWAGHERLKKSDLPKISLETCLMRACRIPKTTDLAKLLEYAQQQSAHEKPMAPIPQPVSAPSAKPKKPEPRKLVASSLEDLMNEMKRKRPSLHALLMCAKKRNFADGEFELEFPAGHFAFRQLSDPLMSKDLEKVLSELCAATIRLKLKEDSNTSTPNQAPPKTNLIQEAKKQIVEDPEIQKAAKILQGKISSVTIEGIKT